MRLSDIYTHLDALSPFATQASWDNSGLQVGRFHEQIERIYLSLDVDSALLENVEEHSLIITHHPLIFSGLKQLNFEKYPSRLLEMMVRKQISLVAMHTNFDLSHLNRFVAQKLCFTLCENQAFVGYFDANCSLDDLILHVKKSLTLPNIRCVKAKQWIGRCAITTGSGGDLIRDIDADCFLSGDFKYHQALEAKENHLSLVDIGHYESEAYFGECLASHLKNLPLKVIMSNSKNPFEYL